MKKVTTKNYVSLPTYPSRLMHRKVLKITYQTNYIQPSLLEEGKWMGGGYVKKDIYRLIILPYCLSLHENVFLLLYK